MSDDFDSLKHLGKKIAKKPSDQLIERWTQSVGNKSKFSPATQLISINRTNWWQIAAALVAGILIGKFILQSSPDFLPTMAQNNVEDETIEYIYTNN